MSESSNQISHEKLTTHQASTLVDGLEMCSQQRRQQYTWAGRYQQSIDDDSSVHSLQNTDHCQARP